MIIQYTVADVYGGPAEFGTYGEKSTDNATYCWYVWGVAPGTWELLGGDA